jgi:uncharacterized protein YceK
MLPIRFIVGTVAACLTSGCGTLANLDGMDAPLMSQIDVARPRAFGGTANDFRWTRDCDWPIKPFFILDLPASLVADVITLPEVRKRRLEWDKRRENPDVNDPASKPDSLLESSSPAP